MKLTPAQKRMIAEVEACVAGSSISRPNSAGGYTVQYCRNGYATANRLVELGIMVEARDEVYSHLLAIKPA